MQKRAKTSKNKASDLWIAPRYSLKGTPKEARWESRPGTVPTSDSRLLELADTALALWALGNRKSRRKAA